MIKFIELQNFGVNLLTFTFIITLIFTGASAYTLFKQNQKIVKSRSGESVSFIFFSYYAFSALAVIIYGLAKHSLALAINGVVGFIALAIIINLWRFKKISLKEKIIGLSSSLTVPVIILSDEKDLLFILFGVIIGLAMLEQITEIWTNKSSGSVYLGQIIVSLSSTSFWLIYAIVINLWSMEIVNSIGVLLWLMLLFSYLKFKPKKITS